MPIDLVCPHCRAFLIAKIPSWKCSGCGREFASLRGIPDLRTANDALMPNAEDWRIARILAEAFDRLDFRSLLDRYYDTIGDVPADRRAIQVAHITAAPDRASQWMNYLDASAASGPMLDLGCGPGGFLAWRGEVSPCWGLDIAMRWLILARKRLDETGFATIRLVCGAAENLPFADKTFSAVIGGDVIEHVNDQAKTVAEVYRVLEPGGMMVLATPNRFSLAPEPHVGVWGVGFLPRGWMAAYVHYASSQSFRAIHTLGLREWRMALRTSPFRSGTILPPALPVANMKSFRPSKRWLAMRYNRMIQSGWGRWFLLRVGPLFHIIATKTDCDQTRSTTPDIPPRSMP